MSDRVAGAAAELYGADPAGFVARRKALADEARTAGDRDAAKKIMALRKPTRAAWVVNRLARADPGSPGRLAALAAELRAAAEAADGRKLRELSARRGELVDDLASRALAAAGVADPPPALRSEVEDTLTSALADPETADRFASATLTRAAEWSGFAPFTPPPAATPAPAPPPEVSAPTPETVPEVPDQLAARRRKSTDDAERIVASAAQAASAAVTREEELEAEVRDLEERLTRARADLATARTRARRAESAERKARQRLDHLPRPGNGPRPPQ